MPPTRVPTGYCRWIVCALLFFATTINYVDRAVVGYLKEDFLKKQLAWTETDFGVVNSVFQIGYAVGFLLVGGLIDRIGVRRGLTLAVVLWSLAAAAHGAVSWIPSDWSVGLPDWLSAWLAGGTAVLAGTVAGMAVARFALGVAEAANFPASIKAVSEWFPRKDRALATGIFNAGANVGVIVAALTVPAIAHWFGWPATFYLTGSVGMVWLVAWLAFYRAPAEHPQVTPEELAYIRSDAPETARRVPWLPLFTHRQTWAFALAKFLTDAFWGFYLYWTPGFLQKQHGLELLQVGLPLVVIYLMADVGSVAGGWLSSSLIHRGWSVNLSRKGAMLLSALCVVPIMAASQVQEVWSAVFLIGLATAGHQGFSANLFTLVSDTVPRQAVSSVVGIGGMSGAIASMLLFPVIGRILDVTNRNYTIPFLFPAAAYLLALAVIHAILPRLEAMPDEAVAG